MNMAEGQRFENKRKQEEVIGKSGPGKEKRVAVRGKGRMVQEKDEIIREKNRLDKEKRGIVKGKSRSDKEKSEIIRGKSRPDKEKGENVREKSKSDKEKRGIVREKNRPDREKNKAIIGKVGADQKQSDLCSIFPLCGGCQYLNLSYEEQLKMKQNQLQKLLGYFCRVYPIVGMEVPFHYRNKVHAVFGYQKGQPVTGVYQEGTHNLLPVEECRIEDKKAAEVIRTIRELVKSFKIRTYDEDRGVGLLRHVLIRRGFSTGELMVVLVTASQMFPSKNHFSKALLKRHPEITTIVQNINSRDTSMVLGEREQVWFGKGYIEDELCGCRFRISSRSFYQINPIQTEKLYKKVMELAGLAGQEILLDAYCGIGTMGIIAAPNAGQVIGVELNQDAVGDAVINAKCNHISNIRFYCKDATKFMMKMAEKGQQVDVVLMDPPRTGSTEEFIQAVRAVKAKRVVYVSCGPDTLARDLKEFQRMGYQAKGAWGYDLFPFTRHIETVVFLSKRKPDDIIEITS